jgi:hypothetical protein
VGLFRYYRWGNNDRRFGPFIYARDRGFTPFAVVLGSGRETSGNTLRLSAFGHTLILLLPTLIKPHVRRVFPTSFRAGTTGQTGTDGYDDISRREYGFSCAERFLQVFFGRQTGDSSTTQDWGMFLPWTQKRHIRTSLYGLRGETVWTAHSGPDGLSNYHARREAVAACPTRTFAFTDYDGEGLAARTHIEESEWLLGEGWFKWLSWFSRPEIKRSLHIEFSAETGREKGSWKGGTLGTGITMLPYELHEPAFRRYCAENAMTFNTRFTAVRDDATRAVHPDIPPTPVDDADGAVERYQALLATLGFEQALAETMFYPGGKTESVFIYGHRADGLLLRFDTIHDNTRVGSSTVYYNWMPHLSLRGVASGYLADDGIWAGRHDVLSGLGTTLAILRNDGRFVAHWQHRPSMRLWHARHDNPGKLSNQACNEEILAKLPFWARPWKSTIEPVDGSHA